VERSALIADKGSQEDGRVDTWSLRFPRVQPGSVLELRYRVRMSWAMGSYWRYLDDRFPVERAEVEIEVPASSRPDLFVLNLKPDLKLDRQKQRQRLHFAVDNLPARATGSMAPPLQVTSPWWSWRDASATWGSAAWPVWKPLTTSLHTLPAVSTSTCEGDGDVRARCVQTATVARLHERVRLRGLAGFEVRKVDEIVTAGSGNAHELALVLTLMLKAGGLDAHMAVGTRHDQIPIDETFTSAAFLNHSVVTVRLPSGSTVWIDPSCESCGPGVMPPWSAGVRVARLRARREMGWSTLEADPFETTPSTTLPTGTLTREFTITPGVTGDDVEVDLVERETDKEAIDTTMYHLHISDQGIRAHNEKKLLKAWPSASLTRYERFRCERSTSRCMGRQTFTVPQAVTPGDDGGRLVMMPLVPLPLERALDEKDRTLPIAVEADVIMEDVIRVKAPPGHRASSQGFITDRRQMDRLEVYVDARSDGDDLVVRRRLTLKAGRWNADRFAALKDTLAEATRVLQRTVMLVPLTTPSPTSASSSTPSSTPSSPVR